MIREKIISMTSKLSFILVVVFVYWMFISIFHEILGLRVFDDDWYVTAFNTVTGGILALLTVSVILNIVFTLTKPGKNKIFLVLFILSFPMVIGLLYLGSLGKPYVIQGVLLRSARKMVAENPDILERLGEYRYDLSYLQSAIDSLESLSKHDKLRVSLIVEDEEENVFLLINKYRTLTELSNKSDLAYTYPPEEYEYLLRVFRGENDDYRFTSRGNRFFNLKYPVKTKNRIIVLHLARR